MSTQTLAAPPVAPPDSPTDNETSLPSPPLAHSGPPLLASVTGLATSDAPAYVRRFKKLGSAEWMRNNRWLYQQPLATQVHVLLCLARLSLPLVGIDNQLLARIVFAYMDRPELLQGIDLSDDPDDAERVYIFELPSSIYGLLVERLSDPDIHIATVKRVLHTLLKNLITLLMGERPYHSRSHIITLYEKLRMLFISSTQPAGSAKFQQLVDTVVGLMKTYGPGSAAAHTHASAYRLKCLHTVHHALLTSTFRTLACQAHYEDLDVLFHYCRQTLRGSVMHWLSQLSTDEVNEIWHRCPHVVAYCTTKAFKLRSHFHPESAVAQRCTSLISGDELALLQGGGSAIQQLHDLTHHGTAKALWTRLQSYPVKTRRALLQRMMAELEAGPTTPDDAHTHTLARAVFETHARHIVRLMHIKADGLQTVVRFYTEELSWTAHALFATQKWSELTHTRLQQWVGLLQTLPMTTLHSFVTEMVGRMQRLHISPSQTLDFRTFQCIQSCEDKIGRLLAQPLSGVRDVAAVEAMLQNIGRLVCDHLQSFHVHRYTRIRHLVRCLLLLEHVLRQPEVTATPDETSSAVGTPHECAVCYNEVPGTLHTLRCGHAFHPECILQTAQFSSHVHHTLPYLAKCPYCMTEIQPKHEVMAAMHASAGPAVPSWRRALQYFVYPL